MSNKESYVQSGKSTSMGHNLRLLDFDDLYLLRHLLDGLTVAGTARKLGLTQPAITQRIRKIERVFEDSIIRKVGRHIQLTPIGEAICSKAADALHVMKDVVNDTASGAKTLVAGNFMAHQHLWQALSRLMKDGFDELIHIRIAPDKSAISLLADGHVDGLITDSDITHASLGSITLFDEEQLMVGPPKLAGKISTIEDLADYLLIDVDPALASLKKMTMSNRADVKFNDAWFLGSRQLVLNAVLQGFGIAVLPHGMVAPHLTSGKLAQLLPELELGRESYRLLHRDAALPEQISKLLDALKATA